MKLLLCFALALAYGTLSTHAQPIEFSADDAATITRSLDGEWTGVLEYANYSDGRRVEIPMTLKQESSAIAPVVLRHVAFTDPGKIITSGEIIVIDAESLILSTRPISITGDPDAGELWTIEAAQIANPDDWTLVLSHSGRDDNRPASIRLTQRMRDGTYSSRKDVNYTDVNDANEGVEGFKFRNEFRVERVSADS